MCNSLRFASDLLLCQTSLFTVASFWNQHQPSGHFLRSTQSLSSLPSTKCFQIVSVRWFRPLRCYKWFFSGLSWTAWTFFCCSSPRVRWSSSTRHPGSRWCWTNTWWPVWTGWCQPSSRSPQSLLGAPEGDDRETTQRNPQKEFPYSYTDWLHGWSIVKMSLLQRLTDSAVKVFFWVKLDSVWKENIYI